MESSNVKLEIIPLEHSSRNNPSGDVNADALTSSQSNLDLNQQQVPSQQAANSVSAEQQLTNDTPDQDQPQQIPKQVSSAVAAASQQQHRRIFKIIVIGDSNVGKTCLTFRFCGGKFLQRSEATIGVDFREKTIQIDDESIKLQIWDTGANLTCNKVLLG